MSQINFNASRIIVCTLLALIVGVRIAEAAPRTITLRLSPGNKADIRSKRCLLNVRSTSASRVDVRCGNLIQNGSTPARRGSTYYLQPRGRIVVSKKSCFLSSRVIGPKRVIVQCLRNPLTPTPTNTAIATTTPTATPSPTVTPTPTTNANLLLSSNSLLSFNTEFPSGAPAPHNVTGLNVGDTLVSIDRRPQNGMLYGLGYNSSVGSAQLYLISSETGQATAVGAAGSFVDAAGTPVAIGTDASTKFGIDFNPTVDRVRVVNSAGQNFRVNPNTGALVDGNLNISPTPSGINTDGAVSGSGITFVEETAYTNNNPNTAITTQYTLESTADSLYIQNPPNAGTQILPIALSGSIAAVRGFDIPVGVNAASSNAAVVAGNAFAVLELTSNSQQRFCAVELATGVIASSSVVGNVSGDILGLALQSSTEVPMIGLTSGGTQLIRFNKSAPETNTTVAVSGVVLSETLVGLDFRPATGQLYSLGVNATANTATLYLIDPQSGAATVVGSTSAIAFVDSVGTPIDFPVVTSGYGFNFNPSVDRIRVVASNGINFRVNPNDGSAVDSDAVVAGTNPDTNISGAVTAVQAASYTNSFAGTTATTLYTIDATSDSILIQNPANAGVQTMQLPLTINGSSVDFSGVLAFEIPPEARVATSNSAVSSGFGYVVLTTAGTALYRVELSTGVLTNLGTVSALAGLAVAQTQVN